MKALAIAMAAMLSLFFIVTQPVQAQRSIGNISYCKSGAKVKDPKFCKENGGKQ